MLNQQLSQLIIYLQETHKNKSEITNKGNLDGSHLGSDVTVTCDQNNGIDNCSNDKFVTTNIDPDYIRSPPINHSIKPIERIEKYCIMILIMIREDLAAYPILVFRVYGTNQMI